MIQFLFSISLFLSATLLFVIQPMVAKSLLPVYGGTPGVWTVCMLFFQLLLLSAYAYAWVLSLSPNQWLWRWIHFVVAVLAVCYLPLNFHPTPLGQSPEFLILYDLIRQLGLPLFLIAASAPLLQFAFSHSSAKQASDPYFLYVASNVGSLLGLLSYPWIIERFSGLGQQFKGWSYLYSIYLVLVAIILLLPYKPKEKTVIALDSVSGSKSMLWIAYSFIPCSLMLGVSFYIATDIASSPLFWILPLALYLLSFVLTFARKPLLSQDWLRRHAIYFILFPVLGFMVGLGFLPVWQVIVMHLFCFMMLALLFHGELVRIRPPAEKLTTFYVCMALGGVLAGLYNGLIAPRFFKGAYEYPIIFVLATVFLIRMMRRNHVQVFLGSVILVIFMLSPLFRSATMLDQQRNFYGIKQVRLMAGTHALLSQNTLHGFQMVDSFRIADGAMGYYGPVKAVLSRMQDSKPSIHAAILGLGTGMLACQFRPDDKVEMVDIDEQVIRIAKDTRFFTYLRDCPPRLSIQQGDGRLVLTEKADANYEAIIVDAFSSDAIPTHLLTYEAIALYQKKLLDNGVLLLNISNRHIQLLPVLTAAGRALELMVLQKFHPGDANSGQFPSEWVLLTMNQPLALSLMNEEGWQFVTADKQLLWTDNYSNLIPLLK